MEGWDHKISADELDLLTIVNGGKQIYQSLGDGRMSRVENKERIDEFRRSIVASKNIKKGEIFKKGMLNFKRPGYGLSPESLKYILGKKAKRNIKFDELIKFKDF